MTFVQWGQQYKNTADIISEKIERLKLEVKTAPVSQLKEYDFRISTLKSMYIDCMKTAGELKKRKGGF